MDSADTDYALLDSGGQMKLERLGPVVLSRHCHAAIWKRRLPPADWRKAVIPGRAPGPDATPMPDQWVVTMDGVKFSLHAKNVRDTALLPECRAAWQRIAAQCTAYAERERRPARLLNLYAGNGGVTLVAARSGAEVWHVESSVERVNAARELATLNGLSAKPIRYVVDDAVKCLEREKRAGHRYDGVIIAPAFDPRPGQKGGFRAEQHLAPLLDLASTLLSPAPLGVTFIGRDAALSPTTLLHLLRQTFSIFGGKCEAAELLLTGSEGVNAIPCGVSGCWSRFG
jgi:23S rRNA (cytosine1962-C5)-methyltransferase